MLQWLGVRARPFRALTTAFALMDLRSQHYSRATGSKPGELLPPMFWVVGQHVIASGLLTVALFARVDVWGFALAGLTMSALLMAVAVIVEFNEVVLSADDLSIVGHRPIPDRTYAAARLANLALFVLLLTASLNIFPAIVGVALRDSGPAYLPAYVIACVVGNVIAAAAVVLIYSWVGAVAGHKDVRDVLAWTQIVLILVLFYGGQFMLRDAEHQVERFFARPPDWVAWLPTAWLADGVAAAVGGSGATPLRHAAVGLGFAALFILVALARLTSLYREVHTIGHGISRTATTGPSRPLIGPLVERLVKPSARASLALCLKMLRRDSELRMRALPALATAFAAVVMGWATGQLGDPFASVDVNGAPLAPGAPVLSLAAVQLLVLAVPSVVHALRFSRDHGSAWLLEIAPRPASGGYAEGARLAACYAVAAPCLALLWVVFAWSFRDPASASLLVLVGWLEVLVVGYGTLAYVRFDVPLSRPAARGDVMGSVAIWVAYVGAGALLVATAIYRADGRFSWMAAIVLGLVAAWLLARESARRVAHRLSTNAQRSKVGA